MEDSNVQTKSAKINITNVGTRVVLSPKESLTHKNCEELERVFNDLIKQNKTTLILDCKGVAFMDSQCLELVLKIHAGLENRGGSLSIVGVNAVCRDILITTRLIYIFNVHRDLREALRKEL